MRFIAILAICFSIPAFAKPADAQDQFDALFDAVVKVRSTVPADARTARSLGTEREGNGVVIDGNGLVDSADFTFIQINFLEGHEANCCGEPGMLGMTVPPPVLSISVEELIDRGMAELAVADLNGDGMLDTEDVAAFMQGARPGLKPSVKGGSSLAK